MSSSEIRRLHELGQSPWCDQVSRALIRAGELGHLVEEVGITGLTSNPTIFEKALAEGDDYRRDIATARDRRLSPEQTYERLAVKELATAGAAPQRLLWASTGAKDLRYRDVRYVEELVGPDSVNTMPLDTVRALIDHGRIRGETLLEEREHSRSIVSQLLIAGIDLEEIGAELEETGVSLFSDSYRNLLSGIASQLRVEAGLPVAAGG